MTTEADAAAARAAERLDTATVALRGVRPAGDVSEVVGPRRFLHAGPPLAVEDLSEPSRAALLGALIFEGQAVDRADAERILRTETVELVPCQDAGCAGAVVGIVTPSMPVIVVESSLGHRAFSPINEGPGAALRFGAAGPATLRRLAWLRDVAAPLLDRAIRGTGVELTSALAEALRHGDEGHNRTVAAGIALLLRLAPALLTEAAHHADAAAVLAHCRANRHFFVPFALATARALAEGTDHVAGGPVVCALGSNGVRLGVRVGAVPGRWFTCAAPRSRPRLLPGFTAGDVHPVIGDSLITEAVGLGAFAMTAAPAVAPYVGARIEELAPLVAEMRRITASESSRFLIPAEGFRGTPLGIDVRHVAATGVLPRSNTGLAHRRGGVGQVGAGLTELPAEAFRKAAAALV